MVIQNGIHIKFCLIFIFKKYKLLKVDVTWTVVNL